MQFKKLALTGVIALGTIFGSVGAASASSHQVTDHDTMWLISQKYGISLTELIYANPHVANPNYIWSGMILYIPNSGTSAPTIPTAPTIPVAKSTFAQQVIVLVNKERAKASLQPLTEDNALSGMALDKAKDMYHNNYFDHNSPTYGSPFDMMKQYGISFTYAGENIAMGQQSPQDVMTAWMNSPGHRQNILNPNFTKIGTAYYNSEWVQEFIAN